MLHKRLGHNPMTQHRALLSPVSLSLPNCSMQRGSELSSAPVESPGYVPDACGDMSVIHNCAAAFMCAQREDDQPKNNKESVQAPHWHVLKPQGPNHLCPRATTHSKLGQVGSAAPTQLQTLAL
eukprot:scaffold12192_cov20-Tisochrysis_lutea.AAC.4